MPGNRSVQAVMLGGSVALGYADEYSDLELGVFWAEAPSAGDRKAAIQRVGGKLLSFDRSPGSELYSLNEITIDGKRHVGTAMISTHHLTIARVEEILHVVIDRFDASVGSQELVFAIQHRLPLHGAELLQRWRAKANAYPKELATAVPSAKDGAACCLRRFPNVPLSASFHDAKG